MGISTEPDSEELMSLITEYVKKQRQQKEVKDVVEIKN